MRAESKNGGVKVCRECGDPSVPKFLASGNYNRKTLCAACLGRARDARRLVDQSLKDDGRLHLCTRCLAEKPKSAFYRQTTNRPDGRQCYCKECSRALRKENYLKNRESILAHEKRARAAQRAEMIAAYGGKCECCGEGNPAFLTLDHRWGDGNRHRDIAGSSRNAVNDVRRRGYPKDDYQLLCYNCNCAKKAGEVCPHQIGHEPPAELPAASPVAAEPIGGVAVEASPRDDDPVRTIVAQFSTAMAAARAASGLTFGRLSVASGVGANLLSTVERGTPGARATSLKVLAQIAAGLGCEVRIELRPVAKSGG